MRNIATKLHYDNLRALLGETEVPSYGTVRRYMGSQGLDKRRRIEALPACRDKSSNPNDWQSTGRECSRRQAITGPT